MNRLMSRPTRRKLLIGSSVLAMMLGTSEAAAQTNFVRRGGNNAAAAARAAAERAAQQNNQGTKLSRSMFESFARGAKMRADLNAARAAAAAAVKAGGGDIVTGLRPADLSPEQTAAAQRLGMSESDLKLFSAWQNGYLKPNTVNAQGGAQVNVSVTAPKAILRWGAFSLGTAESINFEQLSSDSIVLNRVVGDQYNGSQPDPSEILGSIKSNGQVWLLNQNGVIFGAGAQVDVRSLVASSLGITDKAFMGQLADSIWTQDEIPVLTAASDSTPGDVTVDRAAKLVARDGGLVLLAGKNVSNAGEIVAENGQVALVAGTSVMMRAGNTPALRGFEFQISGSNGGLARNDGLVDVEAGNVSLVGLDVTNNGALLASTSVTATGSITLNARDQFAYDYAETELINTRSGLLTLGEGSTIAVLPQVEDGKITIADLALAARSAISLSGWKIHLQKDSLIQAPSGDVTISASYNPTWIGADGNEESRVYLDAGAQIDVAGVKGVNADVGKNIVQVELRANELRDSPFQRAGFLYGRKVYVDLSRSGRFTDDLMQDVEWFKDQRGIWYGTPVADASGYIGQVRNNVAELSTTGGTIKLNSFGDVITSAGSKLDASGGSIKYAAGWVNTTQLVTSSGKFVDIADADPSEHYVGLAGSLTINDTRWGVTTTYDAPLFSGRRYDPGYEDGARAGTIEVSAPVLHMDGAMVAKAQPGERQRDAGALGGVLRLGSVGNDPTRSALVADVRLQAAAASTGATPAFDSAPLERGGLALSTDLLSQGGFGQFEINSSGRVDLVAGASLTLPDQGAVRIAASEINIDGAIVSHGGRIRLSTEPFGAGFTIPEGATSDITIGGDAVLDVSGRWINDYLDPEHGANAPLAIHGGSIQLLAPGFKTNVADGGREGGTVTLTKGSLIDVSGGGHVTSEGGLTPGNGGSLALQGRDLVIGGDIAAEALGAGGTLSLTTSSIVITDDATFMQNGRLEAGQKAPFAVRLIDNVVLKAGDMLTFPLNYTATTLLPGQSLGSTTIPILPSDFAIAADWTVPDGTTVYTSPFAIYRGGSVIPAGTTLTTVTQIPAFYMLPADAFPSGLPIQPITGTLAPGPVPFEVTLAAGSVIQGGAFFDRDVQIAKPTLLTTDFFRQGFGSYDINGYNALVVPDGTVVEAARAFRYAPENYRDLASGSRVSAVTEWRPAGQRDAADLSLSSSRELYTVDRGFASVSSYTGDLLIGKGATVRVDPGAALALAAGRLLNLDGTLEARGGTINLSLAGADRTTTDTNMAESIWLGSTARIDASGVTLLDYDRYGRSIGKVLDGGTVTLFDGYRGNIVTEAGSLIDVSGAVGTLDIPVYNNGVMGSWRSQQIASDGGTISFTASGAYRAGTEWESPGEHGGMILAGDLRAAGGNTGARNGRLEIALGGRNPTSQMPVPTSLQVIAGNLAEFAYKPGDEINFGPQTRGQISADTIAAGGFDHVKLTSDDDVSIQGGANLTANRSVTIDAWRLGALAADTADGISPAAGRIVADYVAIGNIDASRNARQPIAPVAGDGALEVEAGLIDLTGTMTTMGLDRLSLDSSGDIRFVGVPTSRWDPVKSVSIYQMAGSLGIAGDLEVTAAQIYPATLANFTLSATDSIHIRGNGNTTLIPLAAGGSLTLQAPEITQAGVVRAPLGSIHFDAGANGTVTLAPGSLTSVSAGALSIPMGYVRNGRIWYYGDVAENPNALIDLTMPPEKQVELIGRAVDVAAGAVIDASGGGEASAIEWLPGPGGSRDILKSQPGAPVFAVVPSFKGSAAPRDPVAEANSGIQPGDTVWLEGIPGLPAGEYTLLPGQYALMPGAFRVTLAQADVDLPAGFAQAQADGTYMVGGRFGVAGGDARDSRTSLFRVMSGEMARKFSQYKEYKASDFFRQYALDHDTVAPRVAADAGQIILQAAQSLTLDGQMKFTPAKGGRGGLLDIAADSIAIVGAGDAPTQDYTLSLNASVLSGLGAESLLIGGRRTQTDEGLRIDAIASRVLVANDQGSALKGPELILVAKSDAAGGAAVPGTGIVTLAEGSVIEATGTLSGSGTTSYVLGVTPPAGSGPMGSGMGALLIATAADKVSVTRHDITAADGSTEGVVDVQAGAKLTSSGGLLFDATGDTLVSQGADLQAKWLDAASSTVSFGAVPEGTRGLLLTNEALARFAQIADLSLRSYGTIDFWGGIELGSANLDSLTLDGAALVQRADGDVTIRAESLTLRNSSGLLGTNDDVATAGTLRIIADTLTIGSGASSARGFGDVRLDASRELLFDGAGGFTAGTAANAANVRIAAPRIVARAGSQQGLTAIGMLETVAMAAPGNLAAVTDFGGSLTLRGARVQHGGVIDAAGGTVRIEATGTGAGDGVTLAAGSRINAGARRKDFYDVAAYASAGEVTLGATYGGVTVAAGATIDLSAPEGGDAGSLAVEVPNGELVLAGTVLASAKAKDAEQGSFTLDALRIADFGALAASLNTGGFTVSRDLTARTGDLVVTGETKAIEVRISAAGGGLRVANGARIVADGADGGSVRLIAAGDLVLDAGASISARGATGEGGRVSLETANGWLDLAGGSTIDVSGKTLGGDVHVRALRTAETSGTIQARRLDSTLIGAASAEAEAYWAYSGVSEIDAATIVRVQNAALDFMAQAPARIGGFDLRPGIELRSDGDMRLAADWDLHTVRANGGAGYLTLRAAGNLLLDKSLSDGFDGLGKDASLLGDRSWSYRLIAGGDLTQADVLALRPRADLEAAGIGDVVVGAQSIIRTGTGDIHIAAGRNFSIGRSGDVQFFNPLDASQVIDGRDAIGADGQLLPEYWNWLPVEGPAFIYNPDDPSQVVDFMAQAMRADGKLDMRYSGWQMVSGLGTIYDPANPGDTISLLDAFRADGTLDPRYVGWKSVGATSGYKGTTTRVADFMEGFRPDGTYDLGLLGWSVVPGTTQVYYQWDPSVVVDISEVMNPDGTVKDEYSWWRNTYEMVQAGAQRLDSQGTVYTAGRLSEAGRLAISGGADAANYTGTINFAEAGGDLTIAAQGDITGADLAVIGCVNPSGPTCYGYGNIARKQMIADWLLRRGGYNAEGNALSAWGVDFAKFKDGVGALGGGDVRLVAGGDVDRMTAAASDNGKVSGDKLTTWGTGNMLVRSGGNADGNLFYVANGRGRIEVGGGMGTVEMLDASTSGSYSFATFLAYGRSSWNVDARGDVVLGGMFNPTVIGMEGLCTSQCYRFDYIPGDADGAYFFTYAADSALDIQSMSGKVTLSYTPGSTITRMSAGLGMGTKFDNPFFYFYAPTVRAVAMQGDMKVGYDHLSTYSASGRMTLLPAQNGNLTLLAAGNLDLTANANTSADLERGSNILLSDVDPASLPGVFNPGNKSFDDLLNRLTDAVASTESNANAPGSNKSLLHAASLWRKDDAEPVRVYALDGSILASPVGKSGGEGIQLITSKPTMVRAGLDIVNLTFSGQNLASDDVTIVSAGRDIVYEPYPFNRNTGNSLQLNGPGRFEVSAGRHVLLSSSDGIYTLGNLTNPYLPAGQGADISVIAGAAGTFDYAAFAARYLAPGAAGEGRSYADRLLAYMKSRTGDNNLTAEAAWTQFRALPEADRAQLVRRVFFAELNTVGRAARDPLSLTYNNFNAGYDAIELLFPDEKYTGKLDMFYSQIKTLNGGAIDLLVPGGDIDIGLTFVTPDINGGSKLRNAGDLGLITVAGGGISTFSSGTVLVNQNRVFTLGGGDIVMWSSDGDIDAGKGSKTSLAAPPPRVTYDPTTGAYVTDLQGEASGAGIATLQTLPDVPAGDVVLMAPKGTVDAGDAGIRSSGNVIIAAAYVRNADNIQAAQQIVGVPTDAIDTGALNAASQAMASVTDIAAEIAKRPAPTPREVPTILTLRFLGFGE